MNHKLNLKSGISLLEFLVAVSIMAIIASYAVPSISSWFVSLDVERAANQLVGFVNLARGEALRRGYGVTLCGGDFVSGTITTSGCSSDGSWNNGLLLFQDINSNGVYNGGNEKIKSAIFAKDVLVLAPSPALFFNNVAENGNQLFCIAKTLGSNSYSVQVLVSNYGASIVCRKNNANCGGC